MKRILIYVGILAALLAAPVRPSNIGQLHPVQVVSVYKENNWVVIETDTEDRGIGGSALQALQNLKDTTSGNIYLDTAEYLLLTKDTQEEVEALRAELKDSVQLCMCTKQVDLAEAGKYLSVHGKLPKLEHWKKDTELPVLSTFGDSLIFLKKVEISA